MDTILLQIKLGHEVRIGPWSLYDYPGGALTAANLEDKSGVGEFAATVAGLQALLGAIDNTWKETT